jgi:hypothetical protein
MKDPQAAWNPENPWDSKDPAFRRIFQDEWYGSEQRGMAGMTMREQDELRLMAGCSRKERKEIMERRRAREQAKKQSK